MSFAELWSGLEPLGRDPGTTGYRRYSWTPADAECRAWFTRQADRLGLTLEQDRNGNLWAWWDSRDETRQDAVVTGSHLDSVPDGGGYDGALGVASALAAVAELKAKNFNPERAVAIAVFTEEEGARFRVACLGSRLITGVIDPASARGLSDDDGITLAAAMTAAGADPSLLGPDDDLLARLGAFVELHVEQGRALAPMDAAIGVAESIWPHGRWRLDFTGRADHAGTARLADRNDPMLPYASTVLAARQAAAEHGVTFATAQESYTPLVRFDENLRDRISGVLARAGITAPVLPTAAGHDAGFLAARIPTAMLFVRNPAGVSHSPAEHAEAADCEAGVHALALVLEDLAG